MKRLTKTISVVIAVLILSVATCFNVIATQVNQDGLEVQLITDKESYTANELIKTSVIIKNTNDYEISNISVKTEFPNELSLIDGDTTKSIKTLKANGNLSFNFSSKLISEKQSNTDETETQKATNATSDTVSNQNNKVTSPKTGDESNILLYSILFFLSAVIILTVVLFNKNKVKHKFKSTLSLILCFTIIGSSVIVLNTFNAEATETNKKSFQVYETIKVDNKTYKISATISYEVIEKETTTPTIPESNDIELVIDQKDFTTTESLQKITGSYKSNVDKISITYELQSIVNNEVVIESGNASIDDNKYTIDNLRLIPGDNKLIVSIMNGKDIIISKEINIVYDRGSYYETDNSHIKIDEETGVTYVDNIIIVYFNDNTNEEKKHEIVNSIKGKVVGHINAVDQYQIEVQPQSLESLISLCDELESNEFIYTASPDIQLDMEVEAQSYIPNDPWTESNESIEWEENNPSGNNWWAESIKLPSTWYYNNIFKTANIGIIDDGFDENHNDLNINYTNNDNKNDNIQNNHGTHVAGIISAKHNNTYGISGVVNNCNIYAMPVNNRSNFLSSSLVDEISELIEYRCKLINISMSHPSGGGILKSYLLNREQTRLTKALNNLLDKKYDFLISKAAGNRSKDTSDDLTIVLSHITEKDIKDRIIVVGNATITNDGNYMLQETSNYGKRIDITAPGTNIYSTKVDGYTYMTGTSQAAPMVTGVAGLVWSVNPNFTGAEVKKIVCNSVDTSVSSNPKNTSDTCTYKLLNGKLSVENAIEKTYGNLQNCYVKFVDSDTELTIPAKCTIYKATDEEGQNFEKYRYVDYCETFDIELPNGTYKIDATPLDENHETTSVTFVQDENSFNSLVIPINKKVVQPEESAFTYKILDDGTGEITGYTGTNSNITIPNYIDNISITSIGKRAFRWNNNIEKVTISEGITDICEQSFYSCENLSKIIIPNSVTIIDEYAFYDCVHLSNITISENIVEIGAKAFHNTAAYNDSSNCDGNVIYIDNCLIDTKEKNAITDHTINQNTKAIANYAFSNCVNLRSITIPNSVKNIGNNAFEYCTSLESLNIPESVVVIGNRAFLDCKNLSNVNLSEGLLGILEYAFSGCSNLKSLSIPQSVNYIGGGFYGSLENYKEYTLYIYRNTYNANKTNLESFGGLLRNFQLIIID